MGAEAHSGIVAASHVEAPASDRRGYALGFAGVVAFSLTPALTRYAVPEMGPVVVGLGRGLLASVLAAIVLAARREPLPRRTD